MKTRKMVLLVAVVSLLSLLGSSAVAGQGPGPQSGDVSAQDQTIYDDVIIDGSLCVGFDCTNNEYFSFDTLKLKENNLRIYFDDTSSPASFPSNDWRITINDSTSGGASYFSIDDATADTSTLTILAGGNVGIGTRTPSEKLEVTGNVLVNGAVTESSDVHAKENFSTVDGSEVLERLTEIPITTWNYKADAPEVRHMGPMAQDFYAAFELGQDDRHIAPLDTNGVALAAIQTLYQTVQEQDAEIARLQQENGDLETRLTALEALVAGMSQD